MHRRGWKPAISKDRHVKEAVCPLEELPSIQPLSQSVSAGNQIQIQKFQIIQIQIQALLPLFGHKWSLSLVLGLALVANLVIFSRNGNAGGERSK